MEPGQSFRDLVIVGFEQMNEELQEIRRAMAIIERDSRAGIAELRVTVAKLETKIGIYSAAGAVVGSAVMTWLAEHLKG